MDLLITNEKHYTIIEFKNIQIAYLGLSGKENIDKAEQLEAMKLDEVLGLKFKGDKFRLMEKAVVQNPERSVSNFTLTLRDPSCKRRLQTEVSVPLQR